MNKDNAKDYLPLVQALAEGKVIQVNVRFDAGIEKWVDSGDVEFYHPAAAYRIKPEPREVWVNHYPDKAWAANGPFATKEHARLGGAPGAIQVRYREVIE